MGYIENWTSLKVWWISNNPKKPFEKEVSDLEEAKIVLETLRDYDLSLGELIDFNAGGLQMLDGGEWTEYENDDGDDIWAEMDEGEEDE